MGENGSVMTVTDDTFSAEVVDADGLSMVDFWATWCAPCRLVAPVIEALAEEYGDQGLRVAKLDVDSNPTTAIQYGVRSIPTIILFKGGEMVERVVGAVPRNALEEKVKLHL